MRAAEVYLNKRLAGVLTEESKKSYIFRYEAQYLMDPQAPAISLTLPKTKQEYRLITCSPTVTHI